MEIYIFDPQVLREVASASLVRAGIFYSPIFKELISYRSPRGTMAFYVKRYIGFGDLCAYALPEDMPRLVSDYNAGLLGNPVTPFSEIPLLLPG